MPQYFSLQEALLAAQTASSDYQPKLSGRQKASAGFVQKKDSEFKPVVKGATAVIEPEEPVEPAPIVKEPEVDPNIADRKVLGELIDDLQNRRNAVPIDENAPETDEDLFKEPPSLIRSLAVVEIKDRKQVQKLHGAQAVQRVKGQQNSDTWLTRGGAKWAAKSKTFGSQVASGIVAGTENYMAHPIANLQNMFREPFERRDISFADRVNLMVKNVIFPNNSELALKLPDEFVEEILRKAQEKRKESKFKNNLVDILPHVSFGFVPDTQEKRALEYLAEILANPADPRFADIKEKSLAYSANLAHGFALTLTDGKNLLPGQKKLGDTQVLLPGESRTEVPTDKNLVLEARIKDEVLKKFFDPASPPPTADEKLLMIREINQIYREEGLISQNALEEKEFANDIVLELEDMLKNKDYFFRHWPEVQFVNYTGTSKGEARGGQERFTWNEKLSLKLAATNNRIARGAGTIPAALAAAGKGVTFFGGYIASGAIAAGKFLPRWAASSKITRAAPILGPLWSGIYGASVEAADVHIGLINKESRVVSQLRQVSQAKALGKTPGELDFVRQQLEREATVTPVAATELTKSILYPLLKDSSNWNSETKDLNEEKVLEIFINIAHARARIEATHKSGSKELKYTTQNWILYHEGLEQKELTDLKAASLQGLWRLKLLSQDRPELFRNVPFYDQTNPDSLEMTLKTMTDMMAFGFIEGFPLQILENSPLKDHRRTKFYKQIFSASGISESQIVAGQRFIDLLKNASTVFGGKTISEWLDQSESFKARYKGLKKLKRQRAIVTGTVSAAVGAVVGLAKTEFQQATQHSTPVDTSPQEAPTIQVKPADTIIPLDHIFSKDNTGNPENIPMWVEGKIHNVPVVFASDVQMKFDIDGNIDLHDSDGDILNNFLVKDPDHQGAYVFNHSFIFDDKSKPVDLSQVITTTIEHKTVDVENGFSNLWQKAEDFRLVWGHSEHIRPDHDYIFSTGDQEHPYGIEIRFEDDNIRNPNDNVVTSLLSHFENKSMAVIFEVKDLLGENKDGHLLVKDCIEKIDDGKGGYYFSLKLDPSSDKPVTLADGTVTTMGQVAQAILNEKDLVNHQNLGYPDSSEMSVATMDVFNLGNNGRTGHILMGYITEASGPKGPQLFGHQAIPGGDKQIFIPVHMASGTGQFDGDFQISNPTTTDTISQVLINKDGKITIPGIPATPKETPPTVENEPIAYTPLPGAYHSPQLNPAAPSSTPIPPSLIPTPDSIIDRNQFKKESRPTQVQNREAKEFVDRLYEQHLSNAQNFKKIDEFIISRHFTPSQQRFIENPAHQNFIKANIYAAVNAKNPALGKKIDGTDPHSLTTAEKQSLKNIILEVAKDEGYTEKEALIMTEFIIQQSFYDNLFWAVSELKAIDLELEKANQKLSNIPGSSNPPPPPSPRPRPGQPDTSPSNEPTPGHEMTDEEFASLVYDKLEAEGETPTREVLEEINILVAQYTINKLNPEDQKYFNDENFKRSLVNITMQLSESHTDLFEKINGSEKLTDDEISQLQDAIRDMDGTGLSWNQKRAVLNYYIAANNITVALAEEEKKRA